MHVAAGGTSRTGNGLSVMAGLCGLAGAMITGLLWLHQQRPDSPLLGLYGEEIAYGGPLREDLVLLAAILAVIAILAALLSSIGGATKPSAVAAVLLGAFALTFPVLSWLGSIDAPVRTVLFPGS